MLNSIDIFSELMAKTHLHNLGNIRFLALRNVTQSGFILSSEKCLKNVGEGT